MLNKIFKKVGAELHIFLNSAVLLFCIFLLAVVAILIAKHEKLKIAMYYFANQAAIASKQRYVGADAVEDAQMLATTLASVPSGKVLWADKDNLQQLVNALSKQTVRNIVVEDSHQMTLASTIAGNVGKSYKPGPDADVQTMKDGKPRRFTERNTDYPFGVDEVVVPVRDSANGAIVGAVVMSTSHIFDDK